MTDARIRELERRWAETGAPEDESALVRARVQAGVVAREALALAAYCGSGVALELGAAPADPAGPQSWGVGLLRWGRTAPIRAVLSALGHALRTLPERERSRVVPDNVVEGSLYPCARRALGEVEGWVVQPGARTQQRVRRAGRDLERASTRLTQALNAQRAAARRADMRPVPDAWALLTTREQRIGQVAFALRSCVAAVTNSAPHQLESLVGRAVSHAGFAVAEDADAARRLAAQEVIAWALGHRDPVRMRVGKRGETQIWPGDPIE
ncbi:MAG: hypothetical protein KDD82_26950 [Planctomycetes bacterium]|nr:hypothetical protein [Planctomycetota bacterium]